MGKQKPAGSSPTPAPKEQPQPLDWELLSDSEKIERLGLVVNDLKGQIATLKRAMLMHNHADGQVVVKMVL